MKKRKPKKPTPEAPKRPYYWEQPIPTDSEGNVDWDAFYKDHLFTDSQVVPQITSSIQTAKISRVPQ